MATIYSFDQCQLFAGDDDPTAGKHLTIQELKLPVLQETFQDHFAGGAATQAEFSVGFQKFEASFKLVGFDPDLMAKFGLGTARRHNYTAIEVITDRRTGLKIEKKAIINARLGKLEADANKRGELTGTDYALNEIMHLEIWFNSKEKIYWDFWTNEWRVDGVDQHRDVNQILRVAG